MNFCSSLNNLHAPADGVVLPDALIGLLVGVKKAMEPSGLLAVIVLDLGIRSGVGGRGGGVSRGEGGGG